MADAATEFLLNNLSEIVQYHAKLITETKGNIANLQRDLIVFKAFLRDTVKKRKKDDVIKMMVKEIHDVVYDVEDIIDVFVTKTIEKSQRGLFAKFWGTTVSLHSVGSRVEEIKGRVEKLRNDIKLPSVDEGKEEKAEPRPPRKKNVVGFEDVSKDLIQRLTKTTNHLDVISLIGMFGLGKTTLAWKIYNDPEIGYKFPTRIWVPVSQTFYEKDIFLHILKTFTTIDEHIHEKDDHELADMVAAYLQNGSFLVVLDDIWTSQDWDRLSVALPSDNTKCKVLITSRHLEVGNVASKPGLPTELRFFTFDESWKLFRFEALGTLDCPSELIDVGKKIAENCDGLPLAIVVIGGILAAMSPSLNITATKREWEKVSNHVKFYYSKKDPKNSIQMLISLSYDKLPYHLRACFLYLGLFPEDYEIPASKLIRMWIGEGFILQELDCTLEETGEKYLKDLINRNLVKAVKFKPDGKVKTCQIHDTLGEFCRTEAATENFLQEIQRTSDGEYVPSTSNIDTYRRLSIHSHCSEFISSTPFGPRLRSFVCFSGNEYVVQLADCPKLFAAFKLLRVLDVQPFKFTKIDSDLYNLVHMRYIALSSTLSILPKFFNQLLNVQTLIIKTESHILEVKADIWKMKHLRHFKTTVPAALPNPSSSSKHGAELQTLGLISVESCTKELCNRARYLKKLGIRGQLSLLFNNQVGSFDSLGKMEHLRKLKLINDAYPNPAIEGRPHRLPADNRFPSGITSLTLCATFLSWQEISPLGLLKKLEVLKLKDHAFMGNTWTVEDGGFLSLEYLHIEETDLAFWKKASPSSFPKLRTIVLKSCEKLREIPTELADIPSLQTLELYTCIHAAICAKKILDAKKTSVEGSEFVLTIYPPPPPTTTE